MRPLSHTARVCYPPPNVMSVAVCILIHGAAGFAEAGRGALSLLRHTTFPLFIAHDGAHSLDLPASPRLTFHRLPPLSPSVHRARRFLLKFTALQALLSSSRADRILMMDADTVVTRRLSERMIRLAMGPHPLAMVNRPASPVRPCRGASFLHTTPATRWRYWPRRTTPIRRFRYFSSARAGPPRMESPRHQALTAIAGHAGTSDRRVVRRITSSTGPIPSTPAVAPNCRGAGTIANTGMPGSRDPACCWLTSATSATGPRPAHPRACAPWPARPDGNSGSHA